MSVRIKNRNPTWSELHRRLDEKDHVIALLSKGVLNPRRDPRPVPPAPPPDVEIRALPRFQIRDKDAMGFLDILWSVMENSHYLRAPRTVRLIRVDNWFGPRWRGFAGKVARDITYRYGRVAIPPFVPSRILSELTWRYSDSQGGWWWDKACEPLHQPMRSVDNLTRYFDTLCPDTVAIWYSSLTAVNGRGSIMHYASNRSRRIPSTFYMELSGDALGWRPSVMNGISRVECDDLLKQVSVRPA